VTRSALYLVFFPLTEAENENSISRLCRRRRQALPAVLLTRRRELVLDGIETRFKMNKLTIYILVHPNLSLTQLLPGANLSPSWGTVLF
jgi:hypothetical protein